MTPSEEREELEAGPHPDTLASIFALLSDETRLRIVRALAAADPEPLGFTALRERVGARDAGRFNYHLGRLRDRLVEKTADGYVLTEAGAVAAAVIDEPLAARA